MMKKNYSRQYETSPLFSFSNASLIANGKQLIDLELDKTSKKKYLPLNNVNIQNNSTQKIRITFNQDTNKTYTMNASTVINFDETILPAVWYIQLENVGTSTIDAGDINLTVFKQGVSTETIVQSIHRNIFKKTNGWVL
jgi:hypothetical protein